MFLQHGRIKGKVQAPVTLSTHTCLFYKATIAYVYMKYFCYEMEVDPLTLPPRGTSQLFHEPPFPLSEDVQKQNLS